MPNINDLLYGSLKSSSSYLLSIGAAARYRAEFNLAGGAGVNMIVSATDSQ